MTEPEEIDEDLFADLYEGDESAKQPEPTAALSDVPADVPTEPAIDGSTWDVNATIDTLVPDLGPPPDDEIDMGNGHENSNEIDQIWHEDEFRTPGDASAEHDTHGIGIKEDGKMFIGGLNWETTDQSLKDYFSQFGEVAECTVMRDAATGRSRGFGFLTFRDPKTVNIVMVKEHYLDGKIVRASIFLNSCERGRNTRGIKKDLYSQKFIFKIDPKRAIPRDEQEKTSKIFVGGVSQEATEQDFKEYFMQYGRVIDATLMMDKDTGRPRGFGFVTFDSEAAVEATLAGDLRILGKPIEVKKAQPRGDMRAEEERGGRGGRRGGRDGRFGGDESMAGPQHQHQHQHQSQQNTTNGMTPTMMVQYMQKMQQFMAMFAASQGGMANPMAMGGMAGMNPAMMQMKMAQMQALQQQMQNNRQGDGQQGMQGMTPQMMQQFMQMQGGDNQSSFGNQMPNAPTGPSGNGGSPGGGRGTPGFNAQEQIAFEQQKYEQQQRRVQGMGNYQQGGPTSWEGMYDDVPQPNSGSQGGGGRGGGYHRGHRQPPKGPSAPANAPTGPRNAGVPGANYRGGGRGGHRGNYHPYRR